MKETLNSVNPMRGSARVQLSRKVAKEKGPIVVDCRETIKRNQRKLEVELGIRPYKKAYRTNQFSIVITRFQISAEFPSGTVEYFAPKNNLGASLGESVKRNSLSDESEHSLGPELSGNVFKLLASMKLKRAHQKQNEVKRGIKVVEVLTGIPSQHPNRVTWLVKLYGPSALAEFLNADEKSSLGILDYYVGYEQLKAKASSDPGSNTIVGVTIDCDSIVFVKHSSESRFSAFWESITLYEMSAKRKLKNLFCTDPNNTFIECTLA